MPAEPGLQPASDHRGNGGRNTENHGDMRHQALRLMTRIEVANNRSSYHHPCSGGQALHGAKEQQVIDVIRKHAADRGQYKRHQRHQNHRPAPECIRQRAMQQHHQCKRQQIHAQGLLQLNRRGMQAFPHIRK